MGEPSCELDPKLLTEGDLVDSKEEKLLLKTLSQLLRSGRIKKKSCIYALLYSNVMNAVKEDARGIRWSKTMLYWVESILYTGGAGALRKLRGPCFEGFRKDVNKGGGKLPNDPNTLCAYFPSRSTIYSHLPPVEYYPQFDDELAKNIAKALDKKKCKKEVILSFDEIKPQRGYEYINHMKCVSGATGNVGMIPEKSILDKKYDDSWFINNEATGIAQFFVTDLSGNGTIPAFWTATNTFNCKWLVGHVENIIERLAKYGVIVKLTSSDGFSGSDLFAQKMLKKNIFHVYDYSHMLKLIRNRFLEVGLNIGKDKQYICMKYLLDMWKGSPSLRESAPTLQQDLATILKVDSVHPADKMCWLYVKKLFDVIPVLKSKQYENDIVATNIANLLEAMQNMYKAFEYSVDNKVTFEERIKLFNTGKDWIEKQVFGLTRQSKEMMCTNSRSLKLLYDYERLVYDNVVENQISFISTLVVENFFGTIRGRILYPTVRDYANCHSFAYRELVKRLIPNFCIPQSAKPLGKAYGMVQGLKFTVDDIELWDTVRKRIKLKEMRALNSDNDKRKQERCKFWVNRHPVTRRTLTLRQTTCSSRYGQSGGAISCPVKQCPRSFSYAAVCEKHIQEVHPEHFAALHQTPQVVQTDKSPSTSVFAELFDALVNISNSIQQEAQQVTQEGTDDALVVPLPNEIAPIEEYWLFFWDMEHTGGSNQNGRAMNSVYICDLIQGKEFQCKVKPMRNGKLNHSTFWSGQTHGIHSADLQNEEEFSVVFERMKDWTSRFPARQFVFVAHGSAAAEYSVLKNELFHAKKPLPANWCFLDSLPLARKLRPQCRNGLADLHRDFFGVPPPDHHNAKADTIALVRIEEAIISFTLRISKQFSID